MRRKLIVGLVLGLLVFSLACNFGGGSSEITPEAATPRPIETEKATEAPASGEFQIDVVNEASEDICYVLISPADSDEWGDDLLGEDETIESGQTRSFSVPGVLQDVKILNCDQATMATTFDVDSDFTLTVGGAGLIELTASNESSIELCYIYISPSTSDSWGDDWLGEKESITIGDARIFYVEPGTYDLLAQNCDDEDVVTETEIELDSDTEWTISD